MATIGGLTTSTSSSIRGYGGLASGLDRDTLIEGMTYGTTSKITQQQQKKQQLEWKQTAIQNITNLMVSFANKYTSSWSSTTNLFSDAFWGRNNITTTGTNSKYVSVSGTASSADGVSILGVKQLAQKAKWTSAGSVSDQTLSTGEINIEEDFNKYNLAGKSINFQIKVGESTEYATLNLDLLKDASAPDGEGNRYAYGKADATTEEIVESINELMKNTKVSENSEDTISKYVVACVDPETGKIGFRQAENAGGGNTTSIKITDGNALSYLGFDEKNIELDDTVKVGAKDMNLIEKVTFDQKIGGKSLTFTYNGTTKSIKMPNANKLGEASTQEQKLKVIEESMQEQLDSAFGKGRIRVEATDEGKITFKTIDPAKYNKLSEKEQQILDGKIAEGTDKESKEAILEKIADKTSTLTLSGGDTDVKEALKLSNGASNRLDMKKAILGDGDPQSITFKINNKTFTVNQGDTVEKLINDINNSNVNIKISYQTAADKFTITSNENGASGSFKITADNQDGKDFINSFFGVGVAKDADGNDKKDANGKLVYEEVAGEGQDAIVAVKYAGSDEEVELIRDTNSFTVDGLTINVKGEFGYEGTGENKHLKNDVDSEVTIDAQVDADKIVDGVKSMIEEYNAIIELVNKELSTKPDRDYSPLTSEQKKELSEDEIKLYEEKAKQGLLFGDSDLRTLSSDLRFIIDGGISQELSNMGITVSGTYSDNGKLSLDESKFRAALASDPERVQELFTSSSIQNPNGNGTSMGIASKLKNVMTKYVETMGSWESKGILIKKAGSESSPISVTENYIYKQIAEINKQITKLQTLLESERDRYIKQFTSLETLISQMNSQSSYLSQIGGSY